MSSSREEILGRIRSALGRNKLDEEIQAGLEKRLAQPPSHPRPALDKDLVKLFEVKLKAVQGGFRKTREDEVVEAVAACLEEQGMQRTLIAAPVLEKLAWPEDWNVTFGASKGDDRASVTPCFAAVAETGSVVLLSGPDSPTSLNFLPDCHIVLVHADQLVGHVEDVWKKLRDAQVSPRTVNFITGPSKTADVEQTIQYGAHGPRALEIIFIKGDD